ncbi:MAG: efflux RND transporter periplasmic adaptor subunit [Thermodesulfovibrionales bacterium]|jgi:HlyD family secretion protein
MKRRALVITAVIIVILAAVFLVLRSGKEEEHSVRTSGIIDGTEVTISSKVPARVSEICCNEGSPVGKGQIVVRLEAQDLQASVMQARAAVQRAAADIATAEAGRRNAQAVVRNAEAEVKTAEANQEKTRFQLEQAERDLKRVEPLHREKLVSDSQYDRTATQFRTARATNDSEKSRVSSALSGWESAQAGLISAKSQVESARARQKEAEAALALAQSYLDDTAITSPVSGTVIFRGMEPGEFVSPGAAIMTIVDLESLFARVDLEETKIGHVRLEGEALIRVEGLPGRVFRGKITEIGRYGEFATQRDVVRGRQDIRTFRVKIGFHDPEGMLKPGMTVDVEIPY